MQLNTKSVEAFDGLGNSALRNFVSGTGISVSHDTALSDPNVKACIRVIAQTISTLPLKLYKKTNSNDGKAWQLDESSLMSHVLSRRPNIRQTSVEFVEQMISQLMLFSEYFAQVKKSPAGKIISIIPFNSPRQVSVREFGETLIYDCITNEGKSISLRVDEILHIRDLSIKTHEALDKIHLAKSSIGLSIAATNSAEQYYKKGARNGAMIEIPGRLSEDGYQKMLRQVNDFFTGKDYAHGIGILHDGAKYVQTQHSLRDSQVLESRNYAIREIAAIFGVPVTLLGISDPNLKDVESINQFFYKSCLQSIINKIEARFNLILPRDYVLKFDVSEYLRGDVKTTAEVTERLFTRGLISRNEARQRMGMQADTRDEIYVVSSNNLFFGGVDDFLNSDIQQLNENKSSINTEKEQEDVSTN
ncbi:phage portal protein [Vibrio parahaemolyticus]|nr:phage portal protein [Vibrio parahaemolyticus]